MSRRKRRDRVERHRPPPSGRRGAGRWLVAAALLTSAITVAWLGLRPRGHEPGGQAHAPVDPASAVPPQVAYEKGLELSRSGRFVESLPYFRRALSGAPPDPWLVHYIHAGVLYSAGLEERGARGISTMAVRSSVERVALMRQALAELDSAERLAPTPRDRATVIRERAMRLQIWGFPWDAFVQLRRVQWIDPRQTSHAGAADAYMLVLEHPER